MPNIFEKFFNSDRQLEVDDYFQTDQCHKDKEGKPGYYKVVEKLDNIYFVYCNLELSSGCMSMFKECPFAEYKAQEKCDAKNCHHTCMIIPPDKLKKLKRIPALKGKIELGE